MKYILSADSAKKFPLIAFEIAFPINMYLTVFFQKEFQKRFAVLSHSLMLE